MKNLGYAEHRFDSFTKPLRRMIYHFHAFAGTASVIIRERARLSREHHDANRALETLDVEGMLQLGMVADACHRVEQFIRFLDTESFDWADLPKHISGLRSACLDYFQHRSVLRHDGFTRTMLRHISRPRIVTLSGGQPKTLGRMAGPTKEEMDRCFARMVNWWRLADEVLKTEFPAWHVQMAFEVFKLPRPFAITQDTKLRLTRLAALCHVETTSLLSEYQLMLPVANDVFRNTGGPSCAAWARAVQHVAAERKRRRDIPCKHLMQVLARYSAYAGSSSGVEQQFSLCLALFRHLRNGLPRALERILVLHGSKTLTFPERCKLAARARIIWAECFGTPRNSRQVTCRRLGALKRSAAWQAQSTSEKAMLRRQRQDGCALHTSGARAQRDPVAMQVVRRTEGARAAAGHAGGPASRGRRAGRRLGAPGRGPQRAAGGAPQEGPEDGHGVPAKAEATPGHSGHHAGGPGS